ncbi:caax prenyl protease 1-like protein [Lasius niger]|uniref:CAAX prenyl protease n=1 Tax=Lasius niger TaxID=67767 RepID=A0A0J7N9B3_LASNI|nr:caax prenyl protease 1-like protein [Lasius niger]
MSRLIDLPKSVEGLMAKDVYEKARAYALDRNSFGIVQDIYSKIFNTTTAFFIKDEIKKFVVSQIIALPLLCGMIWIVKNGGDYFFWYLWILSVVVSLFMMILYPEVIAPLFDKYSPLPDGELKQKIEELAASLKFPLYKLFIVEGSKRSSHSNAYLYGFHKHKRIVLFDTLIKGYCKKDDGDSDKDCGCETNEILAVLAHELGHWKHNHTLKGFLLSQIFNFVSVVISRRFEFQADEFATRLGHGEALKAALLKLQKDNLGYPLFDKLYSSWHHSHPPIIERLEVIDKKK